MIRGVCCGCNLLCDDVSAREGVGGLDPAEGFCHLGQEWLRAEKYHVPAAAAIDGEAVTLDAALAELPRRVARARHLQIVGLSRLSPPEVHIAAELARKFRGSIDIDFQPVSPSEFALQKVGRVTATLGEIRGRSDVVVCWFCDPSTTHPRLLERIGAVGKRLVFVGDSAVRVAPEHPQAERIELSAEDADRCLAWLRWTMREERGEGWGEIPNKFAGIIEIVRRANHLAVIAAPSSFRGDFSAMALHQAVRDLNDRQRAVLLLLRDDAWGLGAENVLLSVFGFARAINLNSGYPYFHWQEFSAIEQLRRGDIDTILWFAPAVSSEIEDLTSRFPEATWLIATAAENVSPPRRGIVLPIAHLGRSGPIDGTRIDDVMLPISWPGRSSRLSPREILDRLTDLVL